MSSDLKRKQKKKNPKPVQINPNWSLLQQVCLLLSLTPPSSSSRLCSAIDISFFVWFSSLSLQKLKSDSNNSGNRKSSNNDDSDNPRSILGTNSFEREVWVQIFLDIGFGLSVFQLLQGSGKRDLIRRWMFLRLVPQLRLMTIPGQLCGLSLSLNAFDCYVVLTKQLRDIHCN